MSWDHHNEWIEIARITAPLAAALIAGGIAICVLRANMKLGRANLRQALRTTEKSIQAAEKREIEKWRREQIIEKATMVRELLREAGHLAYLHLGFEGTTILTGSQYKMVEFDGFYAPSPIDTSIELHARRVRLSEYIAELELVSDAHLMKTLHKLEHDLSSIVDAISDYEEALQSPNQTLSRVSTEGVQFEVDLGQIEKKIVDLRADLGNPVDTFSDAVRKDLGLPSRQAL
ncbi:hypothetical protein [Dietzia sp. PP-33]|uniref:hypothetical protein n=1 Tax=Dietzia sp. PP-33 TaxID=2957500 RepID=UPI0029A3D513|nr:hypothetical protein [Dietzia sp. PP-33]MDX2357248.1 hypothetical protein [Dietzia sp. PP-33]